jgi:glycosyltransferase involved in cell wall biosynthesis
MNFGMNNRTAIQDRPVLVVMPLYNAAAFVRKAVDSIFSQTYTDFRLLLVNDGSTDGSAEIASRYVGSKLVMLHQVKSGPGSAMNLAIQYARENHFPFIARMDADDLSLPARLEVQHRLLSRHPGAAACSSNCYYMDAETEETVGTSTVPSRTPMIKWEIENGMRGLVQGASFFRTAALVEIGGYRPWFRYAEETDLFLRLGERFDLVNAKEYLYKIRLHNNSLSLKNVRENVLYHFYALDCSRNRREGRREEDFQSFLEKADWRFSIRVRREEFVLNLWRSNISKKNPLSLVFAALADPRRALARVLRKL